MLGRSPLSALPLSTLPAAASGNVSLNVGSSSEASSAATLVERIATAVTSSSEDFTGATVTIPASTSNGGAGAWTFGGRRRALPKYLTHLGDIDSSSESSSAAVMGVRPRIGMAVTSDAASGSAAALAERLSMRAASGSSASAGAEFEVSHWSSVEDENDMVLAALYLLEMA